MQAGRGGGGAARGPARAPRPPRGVRGVAGAGLTGAAARLPVPSPSCLPLPLLRRRWRWNAGLSCAHTDTHTLNTVHPACSASPSCGTACFVWRRAMQRRWRRRWVCGSGANRLQRGALSQLHGRFSGAPRPRLRTQSSPCQCPLLQDNLRRQHTGQAPVRLRKPSAYLYIEGRWLGRGAGGHTLSGTIRVHLCSCCMAPDAWLHMWRCNSLSIPPRCRHLLQRHTRPHSIRLLRAHPPIQPVRGQPRRWRHPRPCGVRCGLVRDPPS